VSGTTRGLVAVFADESCLGNGKEGDNPGGAGALVEYRQPVSGTIVRRDIWLSEPSTTNNRMALRSVIESLRAVGAKGAQFDIIFTTDSRYIVDGMTQWVHAWARQGWKRKSGAIENLARHCRGALFLEVLTKRDWEENCDRRVTDGDVHLRTGNWYRRRLAPHFLAAGGGLWIGRGAGVTLFELETTG